MPFHHSGLIASALVAGWIAVPGAALAQSDAPEAPATDQSQTEQQTDVPAEAVTPTDEQLEAFAAATIDIVQIREAAQAQMQAAVERAGLTVEEYNGIAQAAQADSDIDQALQQLIRDRLGG